MNQFLSILGLCTILALIGCADAKLVNVAADADAAKIEQYNRLNQQSQTELAMDEADEG